MLLAVILAIRPRRCRLSGRSSRPPGEAADTPAVVQRREGGRLPPGAGSGAPTAMSDQPQRKCTSQESRCRAKCTSQAACPTIPPTRRPVKAAEGRDRRGSRPSRPENVIGPGGGA